MNNNKIHDRERLTRRQKEANDHQYYRDKIDSYDNESYYNNSYDGVHEHKRMQINFDLFNNRLNMEDLQYVCTPYGQGLGDLPATMANRDISSHRIKSLVGMEMGRKFGYRVLATNSEATTRREEEETSRIKDYVVAGIMRPIRQQIEMKYQEELSGSLSPQQRQQIMAQIEKETESQTPDAVRKYMQRNHQDPAEVQGNQMLRYLEKEQDIKRKFSKGFQYGMLSAYFLFYVGIQGGKPVLKNVNPKRFSCDKSPDNDFIEDGEWAAYEFRMQPSEVVRDFDLTNDEIDKIYSNQHYYAEDRIREAMFTDREDLDEENLYNTIKVLHVTWRGLRKIGWLTYIDNEGNLQEKMMVDEEYKLSREAGDVKIKWEWIPIVEEGYKIGSDIYKGMGPVAGQHKDLDNLKICKLPYKGAVLDNMNSRPTCPMDRMRYYQYLANVIWYRIELLMASDKGKKLMMNIHAIPESEGINIKQWQYYFESSPIAWYNPDEEGMTSSDVNTIAKVVDMSLVSDISKYMNILESLDQACGKSVGVTDSVLGQTGISEKVGNNQQNLVQTSYILEPYFDLFNSVKKNVLQSLLDTAKTAYIASDLKRLVYTLDDMSVQILNLDINLLENSTLGLFVEDGSIATEGKELVRQLAHAAMQNQTVEFSDMLTVLKQDTITEAEEALRVAEEQRHQREQVAQEREHQFKAEEAQKERDGKQEEHNNKLEEIRVAEEEKRETKIIEMTLGGLSYNPDKDFDKDGQLDILEVARDGLNATILQQEQARKDKELNFKIKDANKKNELKEKEINKKTVGSSK